MVRMDGLEDAADPWEAFALGSLAPLGPFSQVHLTPKIPPAMLNTALINYLTLQSDELLLALVDGGAGRLDGCCALTTRRIYWVAVDDGDPQASKSAARWPVLRRQRELRCQAVNYEALPAAITESRGGDGSFRLDLGSERALVLKSDDSRLSRSLARYLELMRTVARTGAAPSLSARDPELAKRVVRAWPAVAQVTDRAHSLSRDVLQFRNALDAATQHAFVTPVLITACIGVYAAMVVTGVSPMSPTSAQLVAWGANASSRVILRHEYWRLITSVFVHGGLIHAALNMWGLMAIGPLVERLFGNAAFAVLYLVAGVGGAIASVAASPVRVGVGASGAICGLLGALLAFLLTHRRTIPLLVLKPLRANVLACLVFVGILGAVVPNIDQEAHLGGLVTGFFCGLLLSRPWPVVTRKWVTIRRVLASVAIAAALAGAAVVVARRGVTTMPPAKRVEDFTAQIGPTLDELVTIDAEIPSSLALQRDRADALLRQRYSDNIQQLSTRGRANLKRLRGVATPYPAFRKLVSPLIEAQTIQLAQLQVALHYLTTGDSGDFTSPEGFLAKRTETFQLVRAFQQEHSRYLSDPSLIATTAPAGR